MRARRLLVAAALLACACASPDDDVNRPPVAVAGKDQRAVLDGEQVWIALDGDDSHDPDGDEIAWRWSVVRAAEPLALGTEQRRETRPVVALPGPGLYVFSLVVEDERAPSAPDYVNVWVVDPASPDADPADAGVGDDGAIPGGDDRE